MINNFNEDYQYDSCIANGRCSINPRISSLQEVLILYLKLLAHYVLKLNENGKFDDNAKNLILNTISIAVLNSDFSESDFKKIIVKLNEEIPRIINEYSLSCEENDIIPDYLKSALKFDKSADIIKSIQLGEKELLKKVKSIPAEARNLYTIMLVLAKSICINLLDLETYAIFDEEGYVTILKLLDSLNVKEYDKEKVVSLIKNVVKIDNKLMRMVRDAQEKRYGQQKENSVSYTTVPSKAILVVGSNIRELEDVLDATKNTEIDVYTHDEMMLAHTFPKFNEYQHLKGQYGQGMENCLLDFATFPGPIVLTRHSLYNVENLYRGRLYTTDIAYSKGVISIQNKDFTPVIQSALEAKGFKTGKECETVEIGYDFKDAENKIQEKLEKGNYNKIFLIGLNAYTIEQKSYFEKLIKQAPKDVLIVSLSYCVNSENIVCFNTCFDIFAINKFAQDILAKFNLPKVIFFPRCDRHSISQMLFLSSLDNVKVYVGKCTPVLLNPTLITTVGNIFGIKTLSSVKKDLDDIKQEK